VSQSPIFRHSYDLLRWLIPLTVKFPRHQRFVVAESLQRTAFRFYERLIAAAKSEVPLPTLRQADVDLTALRFYVRLCRDFHLITMDQYRHASERLAEIGRLLGGWIIKQQEKLDG
jgi:hypothetical protein